jgi:hypothetical protein
MQEVMKGMDKIILDDKGGALPYLPLNSKGGVNAQ